MAKTNTKNFDMVVMEKKALITLIEKCMDELESYEKYSVCDMVETGERQRKNWSDELIYLDENGEKTTEVTNTPYMEKVYEYRLPKEPTYEQKASIKALETIRETLASLV